MKTTNKNRFDSMPNFLWMILILLVASCNSPAPDSGALPRSTPEEEGVSSQSIVNFIDAIEQGGQELHSFIYLRHGKVIAEGWWNPYQPDLRHTLYSTSKSFTSTAVGFAVSEGLLSVEDKVIIFFPELLPETVSENLASMRVKDLLMMSAGMDPDPTYTLRASEENWAKTFLEIPVQYQPGTVFLYNSGATYMLSAIISKVSGQTVLEYLTPRLFEPLAIEGMDWETDLEGLSSGGWGLRLKTEDMAKFGLLYLQKGKWYGKQILPESWVEEATSKQIEQAPQLSDEQKANSDWLQGYGYQFWRSRHNSYRADGAFGQLILVLPEHDVVIAVNAEASDMQKELNIVWDNLLPGIKDKKLADDLEANDRLNSRLETLALAPPEASDNEITREAIQGRTLEFETASGIQTWILGFEPGRCYATVTLEDGTKHMLAFGAGEWVHGQTMIPGPNLISLYEANADILLPAKVAGAFTWQEERCLQLFLRYIESPHTSTYTLIFEGDNVILTHTASQGRLGDLAEMKGRIVE